MSDTVYVLGAGFNRGIQDSHNFHPPLATDVFQVMLNHPRFSRIIQLDEFKRILNYISKYWHVDTEALRTSSFDLEELVTMLYLQLSDQPDDEASLQEYLEIADVRQQLFSYFFYLLSGFYDFASFNTPLYAMVRQVVSDHATVLTFNYDTLLEDKMQSILGVSEGGRPPRIRTEDRMRGNFALTDDDLIQSHSNWNVNLAYGFQFDEVALPVAGVPYMIPGERYYQIQTNQLYDSPILKLHGSLNWYRRTSIMPYPTPRIRVAKNPEEGQIVRTRGSHFFHGSYTDENGWLLDPVIIPPVLVKDFTTHPFPAIWRRAQVALAQCRKLIIIGYSFPPTDFAVKRLFLEAFSSHHPEELVIVNPSAEHRRIAMKYCNYPGTALEFNDLNDYAIHLEG